MTQSGRIVYVVNAFEKDAPTAVTIALGKAMQAEGWSVMYVAWSRGGPVEKTLQSTGIRTRVLGRGLARNVASLRKILLDFTPAIVHAVLARPTIGAALTRRILPQHLRMTWIAADHGVHEWYEKGIIRGHIMDFVMPKILTSMDAVVCVSESAAEELIRRGVRPERVRIVHNGIDTKRFHPEERLNRERFLAEHFPLYTPGAACILIGSAGNLRRIKGYDDLVEALPQILALMPNARFVVWGDGPERDRLIAKADKLNVRHAINFCGYDDAMEGRLPLLDLYVQPSRTESFGMAAAEAMACGVPVLVSDAGGLKYLVEHGVSGEVFAAGDVAAFANQVVGLAEDGEKRARLGQAGRQRIEEHFSQEKLENEMRKIYRELCITEESE